jgi:hypothetical protein
MQLVAKMDEDSPLFMIARVNFKFICDLDLFISLSCLMPMLEIVHGLIKLTQKRDFLFVIMLQKSRFAKDNYIFTIQILP